mmetsp:Transcript_11715/g.41852  ORF Transcript_11715/g.41852 Transcript_11715/m.41852 type:complete len:190 (+) Transcript_11715:45-614(+)
MIARLPSRPGTSSAAVTTAKVPSAGAAPAGAATRADVRVTAPEALSGAAPWQLPDLALSARGPPARIYVETAVVLLSPNSRGKPAHLVDLGEPGLLLGTPGMSSSCLGAQHLEPDGSLASPSASTVLNLTAWGPGQAPKLGLLPAGKGEVRRARLPANLSVRSRLPAVGGSPPSSSAGSSPEKRRRFGM